MTWKPYDPIEIRLARESASCMPSKDYDRDRLTLRLIAVRREAGLLPDEMTWRKTSDPLRWRPTPHTRKAK